ncbi:MAG: bifunctional metallophosphatase/5'-nucleotidase [Spirochaetes bacterium]|nr:bifunctional metallophosphatase/5'-nucleotidase [Spirochaetota bacterium]
MIQRKRAFRFLIVAMVVLLLSAPAFLFGGEREHIPELVIVNMADTHSAYDTYPLILSAVEGITQELDYGDLVFLINGDLFEFGNAAARKSQGLADWEFLSRLKRYGTVIVNIGNHEFDFVSPENFIETARSYGVTVIGTVRTVPDGALLAPEYTDLETDGKTVRVIGIATNQINTYPKEYRETITVPDPVAWTDEHYNAVLGSADYSILLSHAGLTADVGLLPLLPDNTLFAVGGHDHLTLRQEIYGIPYMHNGFCGEKLNVAEVHLEGAYPRVVFHDIKTADISKGDAGMEEAIGLIRAQYLDAEDTAPVGVVPEDMTVLEAAYWAVETVRDAIGADVAFLNHTSFGSGLQAGMLPKYGFDKFMRFDNKVMRATVSADTLRTILALSNQHLMKSLDDRTGDFLYASDIDVEYGREYEIVTSSWVALDFNQMRYLGAEIPFEEIPGVTTKQILASALQ